MKIPIIVMFSLFLSACSGSVDMTESHKIKISDEQAKRNYEAETDKDGKVLGCDKRLPRREYIDCHIRQSRKETP